MNSRTWIQKALTIRLWCAFAATAAKGCRLFWRACWELLWITYRQYTIRNRRDWSLFKNCGALLSCRLSSMRRLSCHHHATAARPWQPPPPFPLALQAVTQLLILSIHAPAWCLDFEDASDEEFAGCICYSGTTWVPDRFDGYMSGCINWARTASSDFYSCKSFSLLHSPPSMFNLIQIQFTCCYTIPSYNGPWWLLLYRRCSGSIRHYN